MLLRGKNGKISITLDGNTEKFLIKMTSWEFSSSMETDETSFFGGSATEEGYKEKTPTVLDWSMKGEGAANDTDPNRKAIYDAHKNGELVEMTLYTGPTSGIRGQGIIDSFEMSNSADGKVEISIGLAGWDEADMFDTTTP